MRKVVIATIAALAIASASAQSASAYSPSMTLRVANLINQAFSQQVRAQLSLNGFGVKSTSVKCVPFHDGMGSYWCKGTYTATKQGYSLVYACWIKASGYSWHEQGRPWLVRAW